MINRLSQKMMQGALALAAALTLSIAAYAQNGIEQKVSFYLDGKVGTETIKKGDYKLIIPEAETGQVEIKIGKKIVAAQFTKRQNANAAEADKMTYRDNGDGTRTIATITPRGQKFTLVLEERGSVAKQ
jgi:hypothetical protein